MGIAYDYLTNLVYTVSEDMCLKVTDLVSHNTKYSL